MKDFKLTELAAEIHADNIKAGWWDTWPNKIERFETAMMLVISELGEAMEGDRKDLMDDHLPNRKMFDVELADTLIRLLDLAGAYGVVFKNFDNIVGNSVRSLRAKRLTRPEQLFEIAKVVANGTTPVYVVAKGISVTLCVAEINKINIFDIVHEKREYNSARVDHKRENRNTEHGKKY